MFPISEAKPPVKSAIISLKAINQKRVSGGRRLAFAALAVKRKKLARIARFSSSYATAVIEKSSTPAFVPGATKSVSSIKERI
ncbi:hypothetical protein M1307_01120 [Patescibacteria group bacterium]|nr:hypothetical protein [Patescibacteria group bacterium]